MFSTGFLVAVIATLTSLAVIVTLILYGIRRKKRWWWWTTGALVISVLLFVITTYEFVIMDHVIYPFLDQIGW